MISRKIRTPLSLLKPGALVAITLDDGTTQLERITRATKTHFLIGHHRFYKSSGKCGNLLTRTSIQRPSSIRPPTAQELEGHHKMICPSCGKNANPDDFIPCPSCGTDTCPFCAPEDGEDCRSCDEDE